MQQMTVRRGASEGIFDTIRTMISVCQNGGDGEVGASTAACSGLGERTELAGGG